MKRLTADVVNFFQNQNFVIVSTIDKKGCPHTSCKGLIKINKNGKAYLLDLYKTKTFRNLKHNSSIGITAVDEHRFKGYFLKGKAKLVDIGELKSHVLKVWENKIVERISNRVVKNIRGEKGHTKHPEALLPKPTYMIDMEIKDVVDLTPHKLK